MGEYGYYYVFVDLPCDWGELYSSIQSFPSKSLRCAPPSISITMFPPFLYIEVISCTTENSILFRSGRENIRTMCILRIPVLFFWNFCNHMLHVFLNYRKGPSIHLNFKKAIAFYSCILNTHPLILYPSSLLHEEIDKVNTWKRNKEYTLYQSFNHRERFLSFDTSMLFSVTYFEGIVIMGNLG